MSDAAPSPPPVSPSGPVHPAPGAWSPDAVLRYRLTLAYDGAAFHGWQKQEPPGQPPLRTVQGVVESEVARLVRQPISLIGASRTDAGVHALGQVAQFDAACRIPVERLAEALNSRLPEDVEVREAAVAPPDFNCIRGAVSKQYRYRIWAAAHRPLDRRLYVYHCWLPLDVERMNVAAARIVGEHDFAGFANADHGRETTVRTAHACRVEPASDAPELHVVISGSGFLYNMVRIVAGTLVEVGRGRFEPDQIDRVLATTDRALAGPTLPPNGLWLEWIRYDVGEVRPGQAGGNSNGSSGVGSPGGSPGAGATDSEG